MAEALRQETLGFGKLLRAIVFALFAFLMAENIHAEDFGTNSDLQSWNTVRLTHKINEKWFVALQNEARFTDNISNLDEYIIKLYGHYKFSDRTGLSFGYKYIDRPDGPNETDPWAELALHRNHGDWKLSHQFRFETRIYSGLSGILPRLRYLLNWSRQIGDTPWYATGFGAVRFNLDEKGEGPVSGFEQVRVTANMGYHISNHARFELGYLYRFERSRGFADLSDHVIHMNLLFTIHPKERRPLAGDQFL